MLFLPPQLKSNPLCFLNLYQHVKSSWFINFFPEILDLRILQSRWLRAFYTSRSRIFPDMGFVQAQANNMNFSKQQIRKKLMATFLKNWKKSYFWPFWALCLFLGKNEFSWKIGTCHFLNFANICQHAVVKNQWAVIKKNS